MSALYLHIPLCRQICGYCDFFRSVDHRQREAMIARMKCELESEAAFLSSRDLRSIYFGGGTPSLLTSAEIGGLLERVASIYNIGMVEEITLEANPDDLTAEYLAELRGVGVNRLSIGVQSFDDGELKMMNRRHTGREAREAIARAREAGFDNIAIDLIFGVDGYGEQVLDRNIDIAIELGVEHIAAYHLTIEANTKFGKMLARGELAQVDECVSESEYALLDRRLTAAGYDHYEISNYAREGFRSRHNSSYWDGTEYLGIGAGAHSYNGRQRRWAPNSIAKYIAGEGYECELLSDEDRRNEMVMVSLRRAQGLSLALFEQRFGEQELTRLMAAAESFILAGYLRERENNIFIPSNHFLRSDMVIGALFA